MDCTPKEKDSVVLSPYATLWAEGDYYILGREEKSEELTHFRIDHMKDIVILERGVDMIFGGINPGQYARKYISRRGELEEKCEISCKVDLWQEVVETFGSGVMITRKNGKEITVSISAIPSVLRNWVLAHITECEVVAPKHFRDEIQTAVMEAYRKYWE